MGHIDDWIARNHVLSALNGRDCNSPLTECVLDGAEI